MEEQNHYFVAMSNKIYWLRRGLIILIIYGCLFRFGCFNITDFSLGSGWFFSLIDWLTSFFLIYSDVWMLLNLLFVYRLIIFSFIDASNVIRWRGHSRLWLLVKNLYVIWLNWNSSNSCCLFLRTNRNYYHQNDKNSQQYSHLLYY